jgi:hypothetical protein
LNATNLNLDNGIGAVAPSGSLNVQVTGSTTFTLSMTNDWGTNTASAQVAVLTPSPATEGNLLRNATFANGTASWFFFTNGEGSAGAVTPGYQAPAAVRIAIDAPGTNVQFSQTGVPVEPATSYRLTFSARSLTGSDIEASLFKDAPPYPGYGLVTRRFDLTPEWKVFSTEFTSANIAAPATDGRLVFWLAPFAAAGDEYMLENVSLGRVASTPVTPVVPSDYALEQNFPNPFNPSTSIRFSIPAAVRVRLSVYDLLGRLVASLLDADYLPGTYQVEFRPVALASGMYFFTMQAGGFVETRRLLLMR